MMQMKQEKKNWSSKKSLKDQKDKTWNTLLFILAIFIFLTQVFYCMI